MTAWNWRFLVAVAFASYSLDCTDASLASGSCSVFITEINPNGPGAVDANEFVELYTTCGGAESLDGYSLVLWKGGKKADEAIEVGLVVPLNSLYFETNSPYFVIAGDELFQRLQAENATAGMAKFSRLKGQGGAYIEKKTNKGEKVHKEFLHNGNGRAVALCLYRNNVDLKLGTPLTLANAHVDQLVDVIFYHSSGSAGEMISILLPEYKLPGIPNVSEGVILRDSDNGLRDRSLSYCCPLPTIRPKWPLAFKESEMTPGQENSCGTKGDEFALKQIRGELNEHRCDFAAVQRLFLVADAKGSDGKNTKQRQVVGTAAAAGLHRPVAEALQAAKSLVETVEDPLVAANEVVKSTERQVSLLASVVGTLVVVVCLVGLGVAYLYIRKRKLNKGTAFQLRQRRNANRTDIYQGCRNESASVPESEDEMFIRSAQMRQNVEIH